MPHADQEQGRAYHASYRKNNKEKIRASQLMVKFGLSLEDYDELWIAQIGLCPVCSQVLPLAYSAHVDHDHSTGQVRGLLHRNCNVAIGLLGESAECASSAASYLRSV